MPSVCTHRAEYGVTVFLGHITIREQLSSKDIDLLALASGHAISQGNYFTSPRWLCTAHHSPLLMATWPVMSYVQLWAGLQAQHPSALLISGGFSWGGEIIQEEDVGSAAGPTPPAAAAEVAFSPWFLSSAFSPRYKLVWVDHQVTPSAVDYLSTAAGWTGAILVLC